MDPEQDATAGLRESELARRNRNFAELLQELRVAQTGVQILFAFLLILPFSNRFSELNQLNRVVYVITLVSAATATAFLIAPVSYHRIVFRQGRKPEVLAIASRMAQLGVAALLVSVVGALFLAIAVAVGEPAVAIITAAVAALYICLWYLLPVINRRRLRVPPGPGPEAELARQRESEPSARQGGG
jgi:O-antigen/teichoic acid export membrane protein